jgi:glycine oxidase
MIELNGLRVVVAGAGAVGSVAALTLARAGAEVVLADPAPLGENASGVAAGMLAPAGEALFDAISSDHYPLLRAARDLWPGLAVTLGDGASIDRSGTTIIVDDAAPLLTRARAIGAELVLMDDGRLFTPEDWRLEPRGALAALHQAVREAGGRIEPSRVLAWEGGAVSLAMGGILPADRLVLATGPGQGLTPIKGQILRFPGLGPGRGTVLRGHGVYAAPSRGGLIVGATMEVGRTDLVIDADAVSRLRAGAALLVPATAEAPFEAFAGVRAATLDGLPQVGPQGEGVLVARGARRNGWLLAPLMASVLLEHLRGQALGEAARAFDPARFL